MSILSITFHTSQDALEKWENYSQETLSLLIDNLMDVDTFILSDVESEMINEGKNNNLLLVFSNNDLKNDFLQSELLNIQERIEKEFGESVMIFITHLHPKKSNL